MKNKFLLVLVALFTVSLAYAGRVSQEEAAAIAARFTNEQPQLSRMHKAPRKASDMRLAHKALQQNSEEAAFYVFNQEGSKGFVIVSADDRTAEEVLGYSENGAFDADKINPNLKWWLSRYAEEITVLQTMDESAFEQVPSARKAKKVTAIPNLLVNDQGEEITWYQEEPYSDLCPIDEFDNSRSLTGCVATAASQIMYKWRWPKKGTGSSSYTWSNCVKYKYNTKYEYYECTDSKDKTLSVEYGKTTYDWDNMLPAYDGKSYSEAQGKAVATLMYHAGVAAQMGYGGDSDQAGGSGAWTDDMAYGLKEHFGYTFDKFITMYSQSKYEEAKGTSIANVTGEYSVTSAKFTEYFNADLEAGRPIIMGGEDPNGGGHEFVCCGRDASNKFYINWGWEGEDNGYFALTALKPNSDSNFSTHLDALIGLRPLKKDLPMIDVTWSVDGEETTVQIMQEDPLELPATPADCESGKVFVGWTASENVDGDKPADLFTTAAGKTVMEAVTYYAVFADKEDGEGEGEGTKTFALATIASANGWENATAYTTIEDDPVTITVEGGGNNGKWYDSNSSWRLYSGGTISIAVTGGTLTEVTSSPDCDWEISGNKATFSPSARTDFTEIVVKYTAGTPANYSNYTTSCGPKVECELTGITLNTDNVKKTFTTGDEFSYAGLVVKAAYSNCSDKTVTAKATVSAPVMGAAGEKTVKVSYTENGVTKEASYTITVSDPTIYTITWSVNGVAQEVEYVEGKALALPETPAACSDDQVFMGWTVNSTVSGDKPADLFTTATGNVTEDKTYYAVFATASEGGASASWSIVKDASSLQAGDQLVIACTSKGKTAAALNNNILTEADSEFGDGNISSLGDGTIIFRLGGSAGAWTLTSSEGALGATDVKKLAWESGTATWSISISGEDATIQNGTSANGRILYNANSPRFTTYTSNTSVSMLLPQLYRAAGASYSDYTLDCSGEPTAVENVLTNSAAQKMLIDGQMLIIRDGAVYTTTGVRVQ